MQLIAACQEALFSVIGLRTVGFLDEDNPRTQPPEE